MVCFEAGWTAFHVISLEATASYATTPVLYLKSEVRAIFMNMVVSYFRSFACLGAPDADFAGFLL